MNRTPSFMPIGDRTPRGAIPTYRPADSAMPIMMVSQPLRRCGRSSLAVNGRKLEQ